MPAGPVDRSSVPYFLDSQPTQKDSRLEERVTFTRGIHDCLMGSKPLSKRAFYRSLHTRPKKNVPRSIKLLWDSGALDRSRETPDFKRFNVSSRPASNNPIFYYSGNHLRPTTKQGSSSGLMRFKASAIALSTLSWEASISCGRGSRVHQRSSTFLPASWALLCPSSASRDGDRRALPKRNVPPG
jgi:hypothetical protein